MVKFSHEITGSGLVYNAILSIVTVGSDNCYDCAPTRLVGAESISLSLLRMGKVLP